MVFHMEYFSASSLSLEDSKNGHSTGVSNYKKKQFNKLNIEGFNFIKWI